MSENAIALASTPVFDRLMSECPTAFLQTCGIDVGLPNDQMGNSEVGHLNLGAGRVVNQDILRITAAIEGGTLESKGQLAELISKMSHSDSTCHLMGLISPGGVHSHQDQIAALAKILNDAGVKVSIHAFLDGRDTPPQSAAKYIKQFSNIIDPLDLVSIGTRLWVRMILGGPLSWMCIVFLALSFMLSSPALCSILCNNFSANFARLAMRVRSSAYAMSFVGNGFSALVLSTNGRCGGGEASGAGGVGNGGLSDAVSEGLIVKASPTASTSKTRRSSLSFLSSTSSYGARPTINKVPPGRTRSNKRPSNSSAP